MATVCRLCPRECGIDRSVKSGRCGVSNQIKLARVGLHNWEEPCLSYGAGSGTVFFSGCVLGCVFCQNHEISRGKKGYDVSVQTLADEFLRLQDMGAVNINLVTPTQFTDKIRLSLDIAKPHLSIPVVYNCGGYEKPETLRTLDGYVDIFLPDFKYYSKEAAAKYSAAADYFDMASAALEEMYKLVGYARFDESGHMTRGVLTRHLVLPGLSRDSMKLLDYLASHYDVSRFALSLMSQYFPTKACAAYPEINRHVTTLEYERVVHHAETLGFTCGFLQERTSAKEEYVPAFDYKPKTEEQTEER